MQDCHPMVAVGIFAADERVEFPKSGGIGMDQKIYEGDAIASLTFPDCEIAVRFFLRSGGQMVRLLGTDALQI